MKKFSPVAKLVDAGRSKRGLRKGGGSSPSRGANEIEGVSCVFVTPLEPPFDGKVAYVEFAPRDGNEGKRVLAVSIADYDKIIALFSDQMIGRTMVLSAAPDGERICITGEAS